MSEMTTSIRDVVDSWFVEQPATKEGCGLFAGASISLPLKKRLVTGTVDCDLGVAETVEILSYHCDRDCSATFKFPLPSRSAVYKFEARVGDKVIRTQTKKKARAEAEFAAAVQQGHTAVLAKQASTDIYSIDLGNLPANEACEIKIGYLRLLDKVSNTVEYVHTATWVPPYHPVATTPSNDDGTEGTPPTPTDTDSATPAYTSKISYTLGYQIRVTSEAGIKSIDAGSPVTTIDGPHGKIVNFEMEVADAGKDFELVVELNETAVKSKLQRQICQRGEEKKTVLLATFVPRLPSSEASSTPAPKREVWLVVDTSGSMMGDPIRQAQEAALFFIKDMPLNAGVRFNLVAFGDTFLFLWPQARLYDEASNTEAVNWIQKGLPCLGGTEIFKCLSAIDKIKVPEGYARQVIFLTDGGVDSGEEANCIKLAKKAGGPRYFSLGIGHGVHRGLLVGLAEATSGVTQFVTDDAAITRRCNILKKCAMSDALLCKPRLTCRGSVMHLVPAVMPDVLFPDQPITILAEVTAEQEGAALELTAQVGSSTTMWKEELKLSEATAADGDMLPVLHAMGYVSGLLAGRSTLHLQPDGIPRSPRPSQEMVDEEVVRAAVAENLVTPLTASVGVLLQADPLDPTKVQHVDVPIQLPHGRTLWAGGAGAGGDGDDDECEEQTKGGPAVYRSMAAPGGGGGMFKSKKASSSSYSSYSPAPMACMMAAPVRSQRRSAIQSSLDAVLARGEKLEALEDKSQMLECEAQAFQKSARSRTQGVLGGIGNAFGALASGIGGVFSSKPTPTSAPSAPPPPPLPMPSAMADTASPMMDDGSFQPQMFEKLVRTSSRDKESATESASEGLIMREEEQEESDMDDTSAPEMPTPEPLPVVSGPISVQRLNELRTVEGFWVSSPGLLGMLGAGGDKAVALQAARPDGVADNEWATLLVLAYLRKHLAGDKAVWEGMAEKAQQWLQSRWPPAARSVAMTIISTMKLL